MLISCCLTLETMVKRHNLSESAKSVQFYTSPFFTGLCSNIPNAVKLKCQIILYCVRANPFGSFKAVLRRSQMRVSWACRRLYFGIFKRRSMLVCGKKLIFFLCLWPVLVQYCEQWVSVLTLYHTVYKQHQLSWLRTPRQTVHQW